jgi:hypothetical protein
MSQPYGALLANTIWSAICSSWVFFNKEAHQYLARRLRGTARVAPVSLEMVELDFVG